MADLGKTAKDFYAEYRQRNKNTFAEQIYLFYPEHYKGLNFNLENKPNVSSDKFTREWDNIIKKQIQLENSVLASLGVSFEQLQKDLLQFKPEEQMLSEQLKYNQEAAAIIQDTIANILVENQMFLQQGGNVKVTSLLKQNLTSKNNGLYNLLSTMYDRIERSGANKDVAVTSNILNKILSYGYLADNDVVSARPREKKNITKKEYTINQTITSISNSISGTLNNLNSNLDETIVRDFLNKKFLNISVNGNNVSVKATMPTGGKKVKADVHGVITTTLDKQEKTSNFGISNKVGSGANIKLHSGGNLDTLTKWIASYKGTSDIVKFLRSNQFKFMLANEMNSGVKGQAWEALQQMIRATLYIWIGNEFMMRDNALTRKLFGEQIGNYNIAFISVNKKITRVSTVLQRFKDENFSKYINTQGEFSRADNYWSQKRNLIRSLPSYNEYISMGLDPNEQVYPENLMNLGNAASKSILKRISYTVNMNKNLLSL